MNDYCIILIAIKKKTVLFDCNIKRQYNLSSACVGWRIDNHLKCGYQAPIEINICSNLNTNHPHQNNKKKKTHGMNERKTIS